MFTDVTEVLTWRQPLPQRSDGVGEDVEATKVPLPIVVFVESVVIEAEFPQSCFDELVTYSTHEQLNVINSTKF